MTAKAQALVHRLRQARHVVLGAELAATFAQILFWGALIAAPVGLLVVARRRQKTDSKPAGPGAPAAPAYGSETSPLTNADGKTPSEYQG